MKRVWSGFTCEPSRRRSSMPASQADDATKGDGRSRGYVYAARTQAPAYVDHMINDGLPPLIAAGRLEVAQQLRAEVAPARVLEIAHDEGFRTAIRAAPQAVGDVRAIDAEPRATSAYKRCVHKSTVVVYVLLTSGAHQLCRSRGGTFGPVKPIAY
jgi:hypothetical protein